MELKDVGVLIATRELSLSSGGRVTVLIGRPEKVPDDEEFYCPYQIVGLGSGRIRHASGVDAIQALELALKKIGTDLYTSKEAAAGALAWKAGEPGNLGFPVPNSIQDLAPK